MFSVAKSREASILLWKRLNWGPCDNDNQPIIVGVVSGEIVAVYVFFFSIFHTVVFNFPFKMHLRRHQIFQVCLDVHSIVFIEDRLI